jgi:hypothetical protein
MRLVLFALVATAWFYERCQIGLMLSIHRPQAATISTDRAGTAAEQVTVLKQTRAPSIFRVKAFQDMTQSISFIPTQCLRTRFFEL